MPVLDRIFCQVQVLRHSRNRPQGLPEIPDCWTSVHAISWWVQTISGVGVWQWTSGMFWLAVHLSTLIFQHPRCVQHSYIFYYYYLLQHLSIVILDTRIWSHYHSLHSSSYGELGCCSGPPVLCSIIIQTIRNRFPPTTPPPPPPTPLSKFSRQLHRARTQTTEPIVKCHTILEMESHDLSPHTFGTGPPFWKGVQKGVNKNILFYFLPREGLIGYTKIKFKNLKFGMGVP